VASAKPATSPDGSEVRVSDTRNTVPDVPRLSTGTPAEAEPESGSHVVAGARADCRPAGRPDSAAAGGRHDPGLLRRRRTRDSRSAVSRQPGGRGLRDCIRPSSVDHHAVPEASPRSVTPAPQSLSVRKSCGSRIAAVRSAIRLPPPKPGPLRGGERSHGNDAHPGRPARGAAETIDERRRVGAARVSFHSIAGGAACRPRPGRPGHAADRPPRWPRPRPRGCLAQGG